MTERIACRRALLSLSDKEGLVPFATRLHKAGVELLSTGGTAATLREAGLPVTMVSDVTRYPEVFGGRVKTLHPSIHGGLLFRRDHAEDCAAADELGIRPIDLLVVNLYPFAATVARPDTTRAQAIEEIDIGGPAMVRAAAKNHEHVAVVVQPALYDRVAEAIESGGTDAAMRAELALAAFRHTAAYDAMIATWLDAQSRAEGTLPGMLHEAAILETTLRYGENPHQGAALYTPADAAPFGGAHVLQGKALSYNNLVDLDAALQLVSEFSEPAVSIIKHTNPCGVGRHASRLDLACSRALEADPVSAFGGIVAANRPVDLATAKSLGDLFFEVFGAPSFTDDAREYYASRKNLRLVEIAPQHLSRGYARRDTLFGTLVQHLDPPMKTDPGAWEVVTKVEPSPEQREALQFLMRVCKHVKSNAIVIGNAERTLGVGAGQMSRVDSVSLAIRKSTGPIQGSVLASDAFFPFRDGLDLAAEAGVKAIVQPGGSRRDAEVIAAADEHGIAMVFCGSRHFRH